MEQLNKWLTLAANVGVLIGVIFLALEIRQANQIAISTNEIDVRNNYMEIQSITMDPWVSAVLAKATQADATFSTEEEQTAYGYVYLWVSNWIAIEIAYRRGMVPESTFELAKRDAPGMISYYPLLVPYWKVAMVDYPEFDNFELFDVLRVELEALELADQQ